MATWPHAAVATAMLVCETPLPGPHLRTWGVRRRRREACPMFTCLLAEHAAMERAEGRDKHLSQVILPKYT